MTQTHTPEWHTDELSPSTVVMNGQCVIEAPGPDGADYNERLANARLIAAAPDLLEALEAAAEHLDWCGYGDKYESECAKDSKLPGKITAAIAKAKGGE